MDTNSFECYFASANGFSGFRSDFKNVFDPKKYDKLFILKGGPGTGKSTLMKKIGAYFESCKMRVERVFCSSDKESLDGIIIINGERRAAIIDGTAPHQTDPLIPGAIDEIVNLGEFWDEKELVKRRDEILDLNREKKAHYDCAYELLSIAGTVYSRYIDTVLKIYDAKKADISRFFNFTVKKQSRNQEYKIISCFGKDGLVRLPVEFSDAKRRIFVKGKYSSEQLYLSSVLTEAVKQGESFCAITSPFSSDIIEAIYFPDSETLIDSNGGDETVDSSVFLDSDSLRINKDRLDLYKGMIDILLTNSTHEFSAASTAHFELEKIYRSSMDFDGISTVIGDLICRIEASIFI